MRFAASYRAPAWAGTALAALSAFCVYTCMYAFRKPFTAADYTSLKFLGIDYKIWLVMAQTIGYTASKFIGIKYIAELKTGKRTLAILNLVGIAWMALLFFAITPAPYNIIFLVINGLPLGVIYGIVFSYLEGRRTTELLGAVLATSFIFASGLTQSAGKFIMLKWNISEWWMPWVTGLIFFLPLILFSFLLDKTPAPDRHDIEQRTKRLPMNRQDRKEFVRAFGSGLVLLISAYILLTIIREYRSNFASNIWNELGYANDASVFMRSEMPASLVVLVLMSLLVFVRRNMRAFMINHIVIITGFIIAIVSTLLYNNGMLTPFWWMTLTGVGLYMGYVPFNCMLFERLIASFRYAGNAGFIIYLADSFGYLGSDMIMLVKNFTSLNISWSGFFSDIVLTVSVAGMVLVGLSSLYFRKKYQALVPGIAPTLNYG